MSENKDLTYNITLARW